MDGRPLPAPAAAEARARRQWRSDLDVARTQAGSHETGCGCVFADVRWLVDHPGGEPVYAHKGLLYARAPLAFHERYFHPLTATATTTAPGYSGYPGFPGDPRPLPPPAAASSESLAHRRPRASFPPAKHPPSAWNGPPSGPSVASRHSPSGSTVFSVSSASSTSTNSALADQIPRPSGPLTSATIESRGPISSVEASTLRSSLEFLYTARSSLGADVYAFLHGSSEDAFEPQLNEGQPDYLLQHCGLPVEKQPSADQAAAFPSASDDLALDDDAASLSLGTNGSSGRRPSVAADRATIKLQDDLTYMWRSGLYADVRIHLVPSSSTQNQPRSRTATGSASASASASAARPAWALRAMHNAASRRSRQSMASFRSSLGDLLDDDQSMLSLDLESDAESHMDLDWELDNNNSDQDHHHSQLLEDQEDTDGTATGPKEMLYTGHAFLLSSRSAWFALALCCARHPILPPSSSPPSPPPPSPTPPSGTLDLFLTAAPFLTRFSVHLVLAFLYSGTVRFSVAAGGNNAQSTSPYLAHNATSIASLLRLNTRALADVLATTEALGVPDLATCVAVALRIRLSGAIGPDAHKEAEEQDTPADKPEDKDATAQSDHDHGTFLSTDSLAKMTRVIRAAFQPSAPAAPCLQGTNQDDLRPLADPFAAVIPKHPVPDSLGPEGSHATRHPSAHIHMLTWKLAEQTRLAALPRRQLRAACVRMLSTPEIIPSLWPTRCSGRLPAQTRKEVATLVVAHAMPLVHSSLPSSIVSSDIKTGEPDYPAHQNNHRSDDPLPSATTNAKGQEAAFPSKNAAEVEEDEALTHQQEEAAYHLILIAQNVHLTMCTLSSLQSAHSAQSAEAPAVQPSGIPIENNSSNNKYSNKERWMARVRQLCATVAQDLAKLLVGRPKALACVLRSRTWSRLLSVIAGSVVDSTQEERQQSRARGQESDDNCPGDKANKGDRTNRGLARDPKLAQEVIHILLERTLAVMGAGPAAGGAKSHSASSTSARSSTSLKEEAGAAPQVYEVLVGEGLLGVGCHSTSPSSFSGPRSMRLDTESIALPPRVQLVYEELEWAVHHLVLFLRANWIPLRQSSKFDQLSKWARTEIAEAIGVQPEALLSPVRHPSAPTSTAPRAFEQNRAVPPSGGVDAGKPVAKPSSSLSWDLPQTAYPSAQDPVLSSGQSQAQSSGRGHNLSPLVNEVQFSSDSLEGDGQSTSGASSLSFEKNVPEVSDGASTSSPSQFPTSPSLGTSAPAFPPAPAQGSSLLSKLPPQPHHEPLSAGPRLPRTLSASDWAPSPSQDEDGVRPAGPIHLRAQAMNRAAARAAVAQNREETNFSRKDDDNNSHNDSYNDPPNNAPNVHPETEAREVGPDQDPMDEKENRDALATQVPESFGRKEPVVWPPSQEQDPPTINITPPDPSKPPHQGQEEHTTRTVGHVALALTQTDHQTSGDAELRHQLAPRAEFASSSPNGTSTIHASDRITAPASEQEQKHEVVKGEGETDAEEKNNVEGVELEQEAAHRIVSSPQTCLPQTELESPLDDQPDLRELGLDGYRRPSSPETSHFDAEVSAAPREEPSTSTSRPRNITDRPASNFAQDSSPADHEAEIHETPRDGADDFREMSGKVEHLKPSAAESERAYPSPPSFPVMSSTAQVAIPAVPQERSPPASTADASTAQAGRKSPRSSKPSAAVSQPTSRDKSPAGRRSVKPSTVSSTSSSTSSPSASAATVGSTPALPTSRSATNQIRVRVLSQGGGGSGDTRVSPAQTTATAMRNGSSRSVRPPTPDKKGMNTPLTSSSAGRTGGDQKAAPSHTSLPSRTQRSTCTRRPAPSTSSVVGLKARSPSSRADMSTSSGSAVTTKASQSSVSLRPTASGSDSGNTTSRSSNGGSSQSSNGIASPVRPAGTGEAGSQLSRSGRLGGLTRASSRAPSRVSTPADSNSTVPPRSSDSPPVHSPKGTRAPGPSSVAKAKSSSVPTSTPATSRLGNTPSAASASQAPSVATVKGSGPSSKDRAASVRPPHSPRLDSGLQLRTLPGQGQAVKPKNNSSSSPRGQESRLRTLSSSSHASKRTLAPPTTNTTPQPGSVAPTTSGPLRLTTSSATRSDPAPSGKILVRRRVSPRTHVEPPFPAAPQTALADRAKDTPSSSSHHAITSGPQEISESKSVCGAKKQHPEPNHHLDVKADSGPSVEAATRQTDQYQPGLEKGTEIDSATQAVPTTSAGRIDPLAVNDKPSKETFTMSLPVPMPASSLTETQKAVPEEVMVRHRPSSSPGTVPPLREGDTSRPTATTPASPGNEANESRKSDDIEPNSTSDPSALVSSTSGDTIRASKRSPKEEPPPLPVPVPPRISHPREALVGADVVPEPSESSGSVLTPSPSWPNESIASVDTSIVSASHSTSEAQDRGAAGAKASTLSTLPHEASEARSGQHTHHVEEPTRLRQGISCVIAPRFGRFRGLIKYIGPVPGRLGAWIGVEVPAPFPRSLEALPLAKTRQDTTASSNQYDTIRTNGTIDGQRFFSLADSVGHGASNTWSAPAGTPWGLSITHHRSGTGSFLRRRASQEAAPQFGAVGTLNSATLRGRRSSPGADTRTRLPLPSAWTATSTPGDSDSALGLDAEEDARGIPDAKTIQYRRARRDRVQRLLAISSSIIEPSPPVVHDGTRTPLNPLATGDRMTESPTPSLRSVSPSSHASRPTLGLFIRPHDVLVVVGPD